MNLRRATVARSACLLVVILGVGLAVVGCQQSAIYYALNSDDDSGYESWQESSEILMVRFVGAPLVEAAQVRDLALLRAAELVRGGGGESFVVLEERTRKRTEFVKSNTAPPVSAFAADSGIRPLETPATEQLERQRQARNLITSSPDTRVTVEEITLRVLTDPRSALKRPTSARSYSCTELLRDIPRKYGFNLTDRAPGRP